MNMFRTRFKLLLASVALLSGGAVLAQPSLEQELESIRATTMSTRRAGDIVEQRGLELLARTADDAQKARVIYYLSQAYAKAGSREPERAEKYCRMAADLPLTPSLAIQLPMQIAQAMEYRAMINKIKLGEKVELHPVEDILTRRAYEQFSPEEYIRLRDTVGLAYFQALEAYATHGVPDAPFDEPDPLVVVHAALFPPEQREQKQEEERAYQALHRDWLERREKAQWHMLKHSARKKVITYFARDQAGRARLAELLANSSLNSSERKQLQDLLNTFPLSPRP